MSETKYELGYSKAMGQTAEVYRFCLKPYNVWVTVFINENTGHILIDSCYGLYAHAWPSYKNRGNRSLKRFLFTRGEDWEYVMEKFSYGRADEFRKFNLEASILLMKEQVSNDVLLHDDEKEKVNEYIDENFTDEIGNMDAFIGAFPGKMDRTFGDDHVEHFHQLCGDEPWEYAEFTMTNHQILMQDKILPLIAEWFRENVDLDLNCKEAQEEKKV